LAKIVHAGKHVATDPVNGWEVLHNGLEHTDGVADVHVLSPVQADFQGRGDKTVPFVEETAEILIIKEVRGLAIWVNTHSKAREILLGPKCLLLVNILVSMPTSEIAKNLIQKASEIVSFPRGRQEDQGSESLLPEQLIQQADGTEVRSTSRMEEF
jgi:hypothetical protein